MEHISMPDGYIEHIYTLMKSFFLRVNKSERIDYGIQGKLASDPPFQPSVFKNPTMIPDEAPAFLHLGMSKLAGCLLQRTSMNVSASHGMISLDTRRPPANTTSCCDFSCTVILEAPKDKLLSIKFYNFRLRFCHNVKIFISERSDAIHSKLVAPCKRNSIQRVLDQLHSACAYSQVGFNVRIQIQIYEWNRDISFRIGFTSISEAKKPALEGAYTSTLAGETSVKVLRKSFFFNWFRGFHV